jgi:hypothetical protein
MSALKERISQCELYSDPMMFVAVSLREAMDVCLALDEGEDSTLFVRVAHADSKDLDELLATMTRS